jgi:hypothetical protein
MVISRVSGIAPRAAPAGDTESGETW